MIRASDQHPSGRLPPLPEVQKRKMPTRKRPFATGSSGSGPVLSGESSVNDPQPAALGQQQSSTSPPQISAKRTLNRCVPSRRLARWLLPRLGQPDLATEGGEARVVLV